jgi:hypothetical protein
MRRFRFRLERVLRYRETREQIAYRAVQEAALQDTLPLLLEQEAHAREVYLQARREREALTQLRLRAYAQHQQEMNRLMQYAIDEAAVYAYQRRLSEDSGANPGD